MSNKIIQIMMKRFLTALLLLVATVAVHAVPADPSVWRIFKTADGKTVRVQLCGDEFMRYWKAENGACYTLESNDVLRVADMQQLQLNATNMRSQMEPARSQGKQRKSWREKVAQRVNFTGEKRCLIILAQFSDVAFTMDEPQAYYNRVANEKGLKEGKFVGSVADYFSAQSGGVFNITFDVVGPYTLGSQVSYGGNVNGNDQNARGMILDACNKAYADGLDFSPYDWDGDGFVEEVYVIYAGRGEATGGGKNTVWPHKWQLASPVKYGNKYVSVYACSNELRSASSYMGIGTICHEFSHCLGYPDMYDTRGNSGTSNTWYGMGTWDLMCSGSYNGNEYCPAGYTAYEKMVGGWIKPVDLSETLTCSVKDLKTTAKGGEVYKVTNPGSSNEYYLIENRQQEGWDKYIAASGIMINHIDYNPTLWQWNCPNTPDRGNDHERITIIPADNVKSGETEAGDAWPYGGHNSLGNNTSPACVVYNDNNGRMLMNILISKMSCSGGLASFNFANLNNGASQEGYLLKETFDRCLGTGANDDNGFYKPTNLLQARNFANGNFEPDVTGWEAGMTPKGAYQCAVIGRNGKASGTYDLTSPSFNVDANTPVTIKFKAAPFDKNNSNTLTLSTSNGTLSTTTFNLTEGQWTDCSTTLRASGKTQLTFNSCRLFLDEVEIQTSVESGIDNVYTPSARPAKVGIYTLSGVYLGTDASSLPHGVYIINGHKVVK